MRTRIKLTPETGGGECTFTFEELQNCNRFCNNGGILRRDSCECVGDFSGRCCNDKKSSGTLFLPSLRQKKKEGANWSKGI